MSLVDHLMKERSKLELAKELAQLAKENAALKRASLVLEVELFWLKVNLRNNGELNED